MSHESRQSERVSIPGRVMGEVTVFQPMSILDLSERGAQVETPVALRNDSLHDFRLSLDERSIVVKGRIAYCQVGELRNGVVIYRCGVEFVEPSPHAAEALRHFVAVHAASRPAIMDGEIISDDPTAR
jgi:PilZ domain-containing protein